MILNRMGLSLILLFSTISSLLLVSSRVLVRPSVSTLIPYNTDLINDQLTGELLDHSDDPPVSTNVTTSDQVYDDLLFFLSKKRLQRRAGKQPAVATDDEFSASAAKGCSMLYMLAANADDALTRLKTNPKLAEYKSSQSSWDNAGALKTYGWSDKKDNANWAYMGINEAIKDLGIPQNDDTSNFVMVQDKAVTVDGKSYVVSERPRTDSLPSLINANIHPRRPRELTTKPSTSQPVS